MLRRLTSRLRRPGELVPRRNQSWTRPGSRSLSLSRSLTRPGRRDVGTEHLVRQTAGVRLEPPLRDLLRRKWPG
jgi:hypothetical protein